MPLKTTKSQSFFSLLQRVGQSLMIPVSVLPAAGLLVALGRMIQGGASENSSELFLKFVIPLGNIFFSGGLAIFENLPVVFAIGVAIGFTGGAGVAALASLVGYVTLMNVLKVMDEALGLTLSINTGVFGGILMGLVSAYIYKRFYQTKLPQVLGFFSGKRLVPILVAVASLFLGVLLGFVWPPVQMAINSFGEAVVGSDIGPAFYAAGKRLLIPVGLHHVFYPPFLFEFGEYVLESGKTVAGESARYFAGDPTAGRFMASEFPIMLFGLPAAALAIVMRAKKARRKAIGGVMLSAALTSIITGITEPIEFAFIFVAPLLYVVHVGLAFLSGLLTNMAEIQLGYTFSASIIDFVLGFFNQKNSLMLFAAVGPLMGLLYFSIFYWLIGVFNFQTPGRGDELSSDDAEAPLAGSNEKAQAILSALGGKSNIDNIDACITRLRLTLVDAEIIDEGKLKALGAAGVMKAAGGNVQVVFGTESDMIKDQIVQIMKSGVAPALKKPVSSKAVSGSLELESPLSGRVFRLSEVPDPTFAQKMLGDGVAIEPTQGKLCSPVDAEVVTVFRTAHAIGLKSKEGFELLMHIGLDTVKMQGEGFHALVKAGQQVKAGEALIEFDIAKIKAAGKKIITPIVVTNMDKVASIEVLANGEIVQGAALFKVVAKQ